MSYPTDFPADLRNQVWTRAIRASNSDEPPGVIERWMIDWIQAHWPAGQWRTLPPADVAGQALHAWQHRPANPDRYQQARLL